MGQLQEAPGTAWCRADQGNADERTAPAALSARRRPGRVCPPDKALSLSLSLSLSGWRPLSLLDRVRERLLLAVLESVTSLSERHTELPYGE